MGYHLVMKILLTGFGPFLSNASNPSGLIADALNGYRGVVASLVMDVSYQKAEEALARKIEELEPSFIVSLGLSAKALGPTFERCAYNQKDGKYPDNDGVVKENEKIRDSGKDTLFTSLPVEEIASCFGKKGYRTFVSTDPGRYICNLAYYLDLSYTSDSLFIHLPKEEVLSLDEGTLLIKEVLDCLIDKKSF